MYPFLRIDSIRFYSEPECTTDPNPITDAGRVELLVVRWWGGGGGGALHTNRS